MTESDYKYDLRQIMLMETRISQFDDDEISRGKLIDDLDSLLTCLRTVTQDWKDAFKSEWWTLEQVHAAALDQKQTSLSQENKNLIKEALNNLKIMIANVKGGLQKSE